MDLILAEATAESIDAFVAAVFLSSAAIIAFILARSSLDALLRTLLGLATVAVNSFPCLAF